MLLYQSVGQQRRVIGINLDSIPILLKITFELSKQRTIYSIELRFTPITELLTSSVDTIAFFAQILRYTRCLVICDVYLHIVIPREKLGRKRLNYFFPTMLDKVIIVKYNLIQ